MHAADISNPMKDWGVCFIWTQKVMEEFWAQVFLLTKLKGDSERELGLPISYLCDRYTTNMPKS